MNDTKAPAQLQAAPAPSWRFKFCTGNTEDYGTSQAAARRLAVLLGRSESKTPPAKFLPMPETGGGVRRFGRLVEVSLVNPEDLANTNIMTAGNLPA